MTDSLPWTALCYGPGDASRITIEAAPWPPDPRRWVGGVVCHDDYLHPVYAVTATSEAAALDAAWEWLAAASASHGGDCDGGGQ